MTDHELRSQLNELIRDIDRRSGKPDGSHVVDDVGLLNRWSAGVLTTTETEAFTRHLANCLDCCDTLTEMVDHGVLELPELITDDNESNPEIQKLTSTEQITAPTSIGKSRSWTGILAVAAACAAAVAVAVGLFMDPDTSSIGSTSLMAQADNAYLSHYLNDADWAGLAGYQEHAKSILAPLPPQPGPELKQRLAKSTKMLTADRAVSTLALDHGQLLLEASDYLAARELFEELLEENSSNSFAKLGLGIAQFRLGDIGTAKTIFEQLEQTPTVQIAARINLVTCHFALHERAPAMAVWERIPSASQPKALADLLNSEVFRELK